jgi:hypothetical protein
VPQQDRPHNVAIAEYLKNGKPLRITGSAATEQDDAIQLIVDLMAEVGVSGPQIVRLYSERQPSPQWYEYFAQHWPNVEVTWSFGPGEEAMMDEALDDLYRQDAKPWWKFW